MVRLLLISALTLATTIVSALTYELECCGDDGGGNDDSPLKIFLLDGQSNMVGMGSLEHLKILLDDPETYDEYHHLWNDTAQDWKERSDVYIKFDDQVGKLKAGLGAAGPARGGHIGPELEFGWFLGDHFHSCPCKKNQPILLLKAAYGGRDLAIDFRPPLAGMGNYSGVKPIHYGWEYREMIQNILDTLENDLPSIIPTYNASAGYELAGLVWFQGWNDMLNWQKVNEYESNLKDLIRSMRLDLDAPDLPIVIGELGMHGLNYTGTGSERVMAMRAAERRVVESAEFSDTSVFVPTAKYVIDNGTSYNGNYHYYGRADTYCHIGKAFGDAMLRLLTGHGSETNAKKLPPTEPISHMSLRGVLDSLTA
eukprot:CAMPEP_0202457672 /NCGR_PEP_ID=MMETSP1360-20130828/14635_1 /ASSEMBLY_ACC=CAM_ASM_000848 /TAXON_ID=515479 /ORGANISM="Licmophora paradoxa, Strain CCMP2313" /LENGTH=367 /DNA_ID=CAMNT_0049077825 /DNA_START=9 /DNA_END=1112 /DNA_ORIENTATION=+